jgi:hypothetical protein
VIESAIQGIVGRLLVQGDLKIGREDRAARTMDEADERQRGGRVQAIGKRGTVDAPALHRATRRTQLVPGLGNRLDLRSFHQVPANPQHVGCGIPDGGADVSAVGGTIDVVRPRVEVVRSDGFDDIVERLDQPVGVVALDRERRHVRDQVRHLARCEGSGKLGRVPLVRHGLENDAHTGMCRFEQVDLRPIGRPLSGSRLGRPPSQRDGPVLVRATAPSRRGREPDRSEMLERITPRNASTFDA